MTKRHSGLAAFFRTLSGQNGKTLSLRGFLATWARGRRARRIRREFQKLTQAYDDAIDRARAKHLPVAALQQAKQDYVHSLLRRAS